MNAGKTKKVDILERLSRAVTLAVFVIAVVASVIAPIIALSWSHQPFPGFLVDQTLVVNDTRGEGWTGREKGMQFRERLVRVDGLQVNTSQEFQAVLAARQVGDSIPIFVRRYDQSARLYPDVRLMEFPRRDLVRLFWLPYLLGLAYMAIGLWIYRVRGMTRPGRSLAFFCFSTALVMVFYFDIFTTHNATLLWSAAVAGIGGALISLALRFPDELRSVTRNAWLLMVPYIGSIIFAIWNARALLNRVDPYAYLDARNATFRYAAGGALFFLAMVVFRALAGRTQVVRVQARIVLLASMIAFTPLMIWILASVFGVFLRFDPLLYMPSLVIFPLGVAIAIFRYRLLEMDAIVNRTILWGTLTAILAGVMSVTVSLLQKFFIAVTGEESDVAVVLTSLILVSAFTPVKSLLQSFVDRRFKEAPDTTKPLRAYGEEVRAYLQMRDTEQIVVRLLEEAARSLGAVSGAVNLTTNGRVRTVCTYGVWRGDALAAAPLEHAGQQYGLLLLGPRRDSGTYTAAEFAALQQVAQTVAHALYHAKTVDDPPAALAHAR